jgi:hypothetical protein
MDEKNEEVKPLSKKDALIQIRNSSMVEAMVSEINHRYFKSKEIADPEGNFSKLVLESEVKSRDHLKIISIIDVMIGEIDKKAAC